MSTFAYKGLYAFTFIHSYIKQIYIEGFQYEIYYWDAWVSQLVKHLPSAQVMISGSWDQTLHWAPYSVGSLLLSLPLPLPPLMHSVSQINKIF